MNTLESILKELISARGAASRLHQSQGTNATTPH